MEFSTRGPFTEAEVLNQFSDEPVWVLVQRESYPVLTPDPAFPELEMLSWFRDGDLAEMALQHLKAVRPDIAKDVCAKPISLHGGVRLFTKHSREPMKLRFLVHSTAK